MATTLIIPGLRGSEPGHWQDWWLRNDPNARLVAQRDWHDPRPGDWAGALVEATRADPYCWLVAHSLGAILVANLAAERLDLRVSGALLVAPADIEDASWTPPALRAFGPISLAPLPFPATVVASRNDPFARLPRARALARAWGARFVDYGDAGHINVAAGFGVWPDGPRFLAEIRSRRRFAGPAAAPRAGALGAHP